MRNILQEILRIGVLAAASPLCGCANITEGYVRVVQVSNVAPLLRAPSAAK